jgi:uncharacterized SAM-binding protein YcdF (DUF218 family)
MATFPAMDERGRTDSAVPIYEAEPVQASTGAVTHLREERVLAGVGAGAALWLLTDILGIPHIFGIGSDAGLIPFAVLGGVLALSRFSRVVPVVVSALLAVVIVVAYTGVADRAALAFIREDPLPDSADAVIALSAGVTADGYMTQQGVDRTLKAVELVKRRIAPVLVLTREERRGGGVSVSPARDQRQLASLAGVSAVLTTGRVTSTHDEVVQIAAMSRARGWKHVVVVTSPFHSQRACATFEKTGLVVTCAPSDSRDIAVKRLKYPGDRIGAFGMWLYETAGTLRYRQRGWI